MKRPRLLQTTAVRFALRYTLYYLLVLGVALAAFWWTAGRYVDARVRGALMQEYAVLEDVHASGGSGQLVAAVQSRLEELPQDERLYLYLSADGERLAGNLLDWPYEADIEPGRGVRGAWIDEGIIPGDRYQDDAWLPVVAGRLPDGSRLLLAHTVEQAEELQELTEFLVEVLSISMLLALFLSILLGRRILGRMETIQDTAGEIMAGDLSRRIPLSGRNDEFDALAGQLNAMLDRIQLLVRGIREVTDNIAHDLRSPLNRLRSRLEVTLLEDRSEDEYRQTLRQGIVDAEELIRTFNALLSIARAEAGNHRNEWHEVDLGELAGDLADLYGPAAESHGQTLDIHTGECVTISGSRDLLGQAIGNLLENAIKYTPRGGHISLRVRRAGSSCEVMVTDDGPGIPAAERQRVLERFVRLDNSRHTDGNGLGLSLVRAVATLHGAVLELGDAAPGLVVVLRFPAGRP